MGEQEIPPGYDLAEAMELEQTLRTAGVSAEVTWEIRTGRVLVACDVRELAEAIRDGRL